MKIPLKILLMLAGAALAAAALALYAGWYDISATDQHLRHTYWLLDTGMRRSVKQRAEEIPVPELGSAAQLERGVALFRRHCVQCHGAPGVAPEAFALGLTPAPASLAYTASEWPPAELYWVIAEGIKMTGMPAWKYRMTEDEMWSVVAFLEKLPLLSPRQYRALDPAVQPRASASSSKEAKPDAERGKLAINQYVCVTCHRIPGIVGPNAPVGPPLEGIGSRAILGGVLPNTPQNLARWLRDPRAFDPDTAMPDLGLTERDARDIAAYLSTLRQE